jgi:nucleotide-binding universal stress UspA family protein
MNSPYWSLLLLPWMATGVVAVVLLLYRRGHRERTWLLIGAVLGPLVVPIVVERGRRGPQRLDRREERAVGDGVRRPCVLIGVDGSPGSEEAVRAAAGLVAPAAGRIVLATVVSADAVERSRDDECAHAQALLSWYRGQLPEGPAVVETQVAAGQPAAALLDLADAEGADLIVVGRRGRGLSRAVLGSAAATLSTSARCPVLLAAPPGTGAR